MKHIKRRLFEHKYGDRMDNYLEAPPQYLGTTEFEGERDQVVTYVREDIDPAIRHLRISDTRFEGVGDWILRTSEFREWRGDESGADRAVLFCSGNLGVGKTYLSSLVIDSIRDRASAEHLAVGWLYCDHESKNEQTVTDTIGAILRSLLASRGQRDILDPESSKPQLQDLMRRLRNWLVLHQAFICIDAVDECPPENLPELLKSLGDIVREFPKTRILLTGRPHIKEVIQRHFVGAVEIPIRPNTNDIRNYLAMRLEKDDKPEAMDSNLRADIGEVIMDKMSDSVDAILGQSTVGRRRTRLEELAGGNGLSAAYTATLARLMAQKGKVLALGLKALMWVLYSERPLREEDFCYALGVEIGSTDLGLGKVPTIQTLLAPCLGLLTVETSSSTVRPVHFTLKKHLLNDPNLFHSPHSAIAEVCLTYLNFGSVRALSPTPRSGPSTMPLLEYASVYWGEHAKRGMTENAKILALRLLNRFDEHISAQLLLSCNRRYTGWSASLSQVAGGPVGFTGLHGVAFLGIAEMVAPVLEMRKWDANAADCTGNTPLIWAARRGQEEIFTALLDREDVIPDRADREHGRTPLIWATMTGCEGVVKMLLGREDVNPNRTDTEYGRTPLSWAAEYGHERIVMMLLSQEDVNPDHVDTEYGRTPLMWASMAGREGVVKILLEQESVNPDYSHPDCGVTPLLLAAVGGYGGIVKMLLERKDVDPDRADTEYGQTPLSRAAAWGHEGVVKMLLEREDVDPNRADTKDGRTPLAWAARNGHEGVVEMLLDRNHGRHDRIARRLL